MTDDKTRNLMEFILEQQAHLTATMGELGEKVDALTKTVGELAETQRRAEKRWERTEESIRSLLAIAEMHDREIKTIKEAQERTDKQMAETDGRLNTLVDVVERFLSNGRGGDN
jgi:chromosome segregation ATPase